MGIFKRVMDITARQWWGYLLAVVAVFIATWIKYIAQPNIIPTDVPITYILAIVPIAIFFGLGPSSLVCVLSLLAYDYFFIPPINQINLSNIQEAPIEAIFLLVGIIISLLSSNLRRKNRIAAQEILTRKKAEAELTKYQLQLEELVKQRTLALQETNQKLDQEIKVCKQIEGDLRLSEERWLTTLSSIGDAVIATDIKGRITFMNPVSENLTGWKISEALNQPISSVFNIINEKTRLKAENPVDRVLQQGVICGLANHTVLIRKDSSEVAIDDSASPIKTQDGTTMGVILIFRDITDHKKAIDSLNNSKERFEILSEANSLLLTTEKPEQIIQTIAHKIMLHLNCDCYFNYIANDETGKLRLNAYFGISEEDARQIAQQEHDINICGGDSEKRCLIIAERRSFGIQAYACHPLKIGLKTVGTISFGTRNRASFTEDELSLMKTVTDQVSIAMERKLVEDRLAQAVQRLNAHMDNSPLAIIEFDPQFRVIRWSKEAEKVFGWSEKEILGRAITEMKWVYEEDVKKVEEVSQGFARATEPVAVNVNRNYRKDGSVIICEWYNSSIYDSKGKLSSVFSQVLDVTERKKAEEEIQNLMRSLQFEKDRLSTLVNSIPDEVWFTDTDGKPTLTNPGALKQFSLNEAHKIDIIAFAGNVEVLNADGSPLREEEAPPHRALRGEVITNLEEIVRLPATGELRYRQVSAAPVRDTRGQIIGSVSVVRDITDLKKYAEALRETRDYLDNLITYANAPIIVWDPEFHITRFNHAFERLIGRKVVDVLGKDLDILFPEESRDHSMEHILNASLGLRMETEEIPIQHKDGSIRTLLWNSATIYSSDGKSPVATIAQGQDITERKQAEEAIHLHTLELEKHRYHLEELVRERTAELQALSYRLIMVQEEERRSISRELHDQTGQSLTVLNLMLAKAMRSPETAKHDLQEATQTVREVLAQVRNLSTTLHPGMLEDLGLLPTLNWYLNDFSKKTGIEISFEQSGLEKKLTGNLNITVYRIIQEALTNIARYAGVKEARVVLNQHNQKISISIKDQGQGFDMGSNSQGVGLRGIRERVHALKGDLEITSSPGKGTTIKVELPVLEDKPAEKMS